MGKTRNIAHVKSQSTKVFIKEKVRVDNVSEVYQIVTRARDTCAKVLFWSNDFITIVIISEHKKGHWGINLWFQLATISRPLNSN